MAETDLSVRVSIIDDHPVVIEGVRAWLSKEPRIRIEYVGQTVPHPPTTSDVMILDLNLSGRLVIDQIAALAGARQRVIAFSQFTEREVVLAALDAGAYAFVAKGEGRDHLLTTVMAAAAGRPYVTPTLLDAELGIGPSADLRALYQAIANGQCDLVRSGAG